MAAVAVVVFYEKPGCRTNARQKQMLEAAGHRVVAKNLLAEDWSAERLRGFFGATAVAAWFNLAAPRVKAGAIDPATIAATDAIALMLAEPILIRRPLIEWDGQRCAGFDREPVKTLLGGAVSAGAQDCSRPERAARCPDPPPQRP
jgi:nitrogenase-associated protein